MGVSIYNAHKSINLGSGGFSRLRQRIAYLIGPEMGKFYDELNKGFLLSGQEREEFFKNYDARLRNIDNELNVSHELLDFLYTSDMEGNLSPKHCRRLWNVIKDYDEDFIIGYAGWGDKAAKFKDFKEIVKQCRDKNIRLYWD